MGRGQARQSVVSDPIAESATPRYEIQEIQVDRRQQQTIAYEGDVPLFVREHVERIHDDSAQRGEGKPFALGPAGPRTEPREDKKGRGEYKEAHPRDKKPPPPIRQGTLHA